MSEKLIDWTKPLVTRNGTGIGEDLGPIDTVHGTRRVVKLTCKESGKQYVDSFDANGYMRITRKQTGRDIINAPPEPLIVDIGERWVNVWKYRGTGSVSDGGIIYSSKHAARNEAKNCFADYLGPAKLPSKLEVERDE